MYAVIHFVFETLQRNDNKSGNGSSGGSSSSDNSGGGSGGSSSGNGGDCSSSESSSGCANWMSSSSLWMLKDVIFDSLENIDASTAAALSSSSSASLGQMRSILSLLKVLHVFVQSHVDLALLPVEVHQKLSRDGFITVSESHPLSSSSTCSTGT